MNRLFMKLASLSTKREPIGKKTLLGTKYRAYGWDTELRPGTNEYDCKYFGQEDFTRKRDAIQFVNKHELGRVRILKLYDKGKKEIPGKTVYKKGI